MVLGVCLLPYPVDAEFGCNVSGINKLMFERCSNSKAILSLADYHG